MTRLDSNPNPKCHSDHRRAFTGRIVKIDRHRGYGFIAGPSRSHIFFHVNQLGIEKSEIALGAVVSGTSVLGPKGYSLDQISTFASPQKILDDLTKPYLLKVCWYDEEKKYGFADLADNSIGPAIMFHVQHLKAHPRRNIIPELRFTATLTNQQGSGRFRVHEILHFDQP